MVPTWDIVLLAFGGASIVYGLMLRERVIVTLLGAYAAIVITNVWGIAFYEIVTNQSAAVLSEQLVNTNNISVFTMQMVIFAIVLLIIALKGGVLIHPESVGTGMMSMIVLVLYGLLSATLVASAVLGFLPQDQLGAIYDGSNIARYLVDYQNWIFIAPLLVMLISGWGARE